MERDLRFRAKRHITLAATLFCIALMACTPPPASPPSRRQETRASGSSSLRTGRESRRGLPEPSGNGSFDFYLLNLSWSPEFCATHAGRPECAQHLGFILHGLWPQTNDGRHPEHCSDILGPTDPSAFRDIYPDPGLLQHEWKAHGTCSGLSPDSFFRLARRAVQTVTIPHQLTSLDHPISIPPTTILDLFAAANPLVSRESLALTCGNNYLTAVEVCLSKDLHAVSCQQVRSCRASVVRILPPNPASPSR